MALTFELGGDHVEPAEIWLAPVPGFALHAYRPTTKEKAEIEPIILAKLALAKTLWPEEKSPLLRKMAGLPPPQTPPQAVTNVSPHVSQRI